MSLSIQIQDFGDGKMTSHRHGWNERGGSTSYWIRQAMEQSAKANPDGYYWQNETQNLKLALIEKMGQEQFEDWAESVYPDDSIDGVTWEEIAKMFGSKYVEIMRARDWQDDPKHYKMRGVD
jgi:hypothetical protein